jgi:hypothetical protein
MGATRRETTVKITAGHHSQNYRAGPGESTETSQAVTLAPEAGSRTGEQGGVWPAAFGLCVPVRERGPLDGCRMGTC